MVTEGPAKKLTVYVDEADKIGGRPVYEELMALFYRKKVAGVSVFRGIAGYGSDGVFHTAKLLELSTSLPVMLVAVDSAEIISSILPEVTALVEKGLVEITDTHVVTCCRRTGT